DYRGGGDISVRAAWNHQADVRMPLQFDRVLGIFRSYVHLQFQVNQFFPRAQSAGDLVHTRGLPGFHGEEFRLHTFASDHWLDRFGDLVDGKIQTVRDHSDRLRQTDVLDHSGGDLSAKFVDAHARADFLLQRQAALGSIDN